MGGYPKFGDEEEKKSFELYKPEIKLSPPGSHFIPLLGIFKDLDAEANKRISYRGVSSGTNEEVLKRILETSPHRNHPSFNPQAYRLPSKSEQLFYYAYQLIVSLSAINLVYKTLDSLLY